MKAKSILHTVAGSASTRRSPRVYTHAVVGDFDRDAAIESARRWAESSAKDNYRYNERIARANPEEAVVFTHSSSGQKYDRPIVLSYTAKEIAEANAFLVEHPTEEGYITWCGDRAEARVTSADGEIHVLQWSMSAANAAKGVKQHGSYRNVRVVPVIRHG